MSVWVCTRKSSLSALTLITVLSAFCLLVSGCAFKRLRDGGISVLEFNPVNPLKVRRKWRINHRDHRKILVVDGRVAFTGGVNISGVYTGSKGSVSAGSSGGHEGQKPKPWRDIHVMIEGPAVAEFQRFFIGTPAFFTNASIKLSHNDNSIISILVKEI